MEGCSGGADASMAIRDPEQQSAVLMVLAACTTKPPSAPHL